MEGKKQKSVRPQIYNGEVSELAQRMEERRKLAQEGSSLQTAQARGKQEEPAEDRKQRFRIPDKLVPSAKRKREQENILKMQTLGVILGVLILALIVALIYEVGLGYGTRQTGNERMAAYMEAPQTCEDYIQRKETAELWMSGI